MIPLSVSECWTFGRILKGLIREEEKVAYTYELKRFISRVEETRPERLAKRREGWEFPRMTLTEKEDRLEKFHPSCFLTIGIHR